MKSQQVFDEADELGQSILRRQKNFRRNIIITVIFVVLVAIAITYIIWNKENHPKSYVYKGKYDSQKQAFFLIDARNISAADLPVLRGTFMKKLCGINMFVNDAIWITDAASFPSVDSVDSRIKYHIVPNVIRALDLVEQITKDRNLLSTTNERVMLHNFSITADSLANSLTARLIKDGIIAGGIMMPLDFKSDSTKQK